jgi:hypothetical protein
MQEGNMPSFGKLSVAPEIVKMRPQVLRRRACDALTLGQLKASFFRYPPLSLSSNLSWADSSKGCLQAVSFAPRIAVLGYRK